MTQGKTLSFFHPAKFIGTWFGVGLSPFAPGTMGSIAALPFAYFLQVYGGNAVLFAASVICFLVGCVAIHFYLPYTDAEDPREMVIDEVAAQWLLLSFWFPTFTSYALGLLLFRLFDIFKPWPISLADRKIHGGFGVMFDDTLAALYPLLLLWLFVQLTHFGAHPVQMSDVRAFLARHDVF